MNRYLNIFRLPELRQKVFIVLGLLLVYRLLAAIPTPGVDSESLRAFFESSQLLGLFNLFSGGGFANLSIVMLGVGPYITATIIMQLLTIIFPKFKEMYYEDGERGRAKFNQYSRMITVPLAALQAYGFLNLLASQGVLAYPGGFELFLNVLVITAGSMVALWLGELIGEQKIGNGISLIIFAGIMAGFPSAIFQAFEVYTPNLLPTYIGFTIIGILTVLGVVLLNEGERKIPIAYARRVRGNKMYGGSSSYLPLKVNQAGMIPLIFAVSVLLFPQFIAQISAVFSPQLSITLNNWVNGFLANQLLYGTIYFLLVFVFTYFYTAVTFDPQEISKNLQRSGGFIPGIRPGEATGAYFAKVISRITFWGATFLGLIAVLPFIVQALTGLTALELSGTALLIVVAVALDTMRQIDSQLTVREYDSIR
ncbi:MAG: preprotein translocase subunit SecY [Anaplasmataceae bacterium]|nr:preprotein translocase subunit SecY [Anaplasmataceae bacterium]